MPRIPTITKDRFLRVAQVFHFFTRDQAVMFFKGHTRRDKRVETLLPHFVGKGKLISLWREGRKVYAVPRKGRRNISHGLGCTECLVRIWQPHPRGVLLPEKRFKTFPAVPDWAIMYPEKEMLLFEFSTADNFSRRSLMKKKIERYRDSLDQIEGSLGGKVAIVLFVIDAERAEVEIFIKEIKPCGSRFMFTDYKTFLEAEDTLMDQIYIWGEDGETYPLTDV